MLILGISAYYHDSAVCLVEDGEIIFAAQEERFTRRKHDSSFPKQAVKAALSFAQISIEEIDYVAFYDKPLLKFERILETYLQYAPHGLASFAKSMPVWLKQKLWLKKNIQKNLNFHGKILFPEHHLSHAASAFFASPFQSAAFLTVDGVGEWTTTSYGKGKGNDLSIIGDIKFPHSLGLFYSAFTYYLGFKVNSGEYKIMGLAPYGDPVYVNKIKKHLIDIKEDGSFRLNMSYFDFAAGLKMTNQKFSQLFNGPVRQNESNLTQREMDIARSLQEVTNEIMIKMARHVQKTTGEKNLCLAGGVALNCVANGKILSEDIFDDVWIQPAAGDAGGALGAALATWYQYLDKPREINSKIDSQKGSYLGPEFSSRQIERYLTKIGAKYQKLETTALIDRVSSFISKEKIIGWFQGRMEFGPRALGNRSIIGDARSPRMQRKMNLKIKYRESFRPFAPSVLEEKISDFFDLDRPSPYMLLVADVTASQLKKISKKEQQYSGLEKLKVVRSTVPAITHVDNTARLQSISQKTNPLYHQLVSKFDQKNNCPVVINTSFNVRGEPIVCTPQDAFSCFMRTEIDYLVMGNFLVSKSENQHLLESRNWQKEFELD